MGSIGRTPAINGRCHKRKPVDTTYPVGELPQMPTTIQSFVFQISMRFIEAFTILVEQRSIYQAGTSMGGCKNGSMFAIKEDVKIH